MTPEAICCIASGSGAKTCQDEAVLPAAPTTPATLDMCKGESDTVAIIHGFDVTHDGQRASHWPKPLLSFS